MIWHLEPDNECMIEDSNDSIDVFTLKKKRNDFVYLDLLNYKF